MSEAAVPFRPQLQALTSLRFLAAVCIVVLHATNHGLLPEAWAQAFDWSKAVSFFFVLSGFVLTYAYTGRKYLVTSFLQARFARLWPAAALSILIVPILLPRSLYLPGLSSEWPLGGVLAISLVSMQAWVPIPAVFFGLNAVTWSISVEAAFYGFFPVLQRLRSGKLLMALAILMILCLIAAVQVSTVNLPGFASSTLNQQVWQGWIYINPLARLPEFVIGILAGRIFLLQGFQRASGAWHRRCAEIPVLPHLIEFLGLVGLAYLGFQNRSWPLSLPTQVVVNQWIAALCFGGMLWVAAAGRGLACQFLNWKPLVFLGEISYGLYLYHQPLMVRAAQAKGFTVAGIQFLPDQFIPVVAWSLVVSVASFVWLEQPAQRLLRPKRLKIAQQAVELSANPVRTCVSYRETIK
jgi:peptidoglycan/LPS O-acetylase OafA/YrhL